MAPNMIDFTIQIDVRRDIWEDYKDAKYAPALIDLGAAVVPKFITGKWEDAAEKITITRQEPTADLAPGKVIVQFSARDESGGQYWIGFQRDTEEDVDEFEPINPGDLYSTNGTSASIKNPPVEGTQAAEDWIPHDGASVGFMNTQAGAPLIYQTAKGAQEVTDDTTIGPPWVLPVFQPGAATITLPETQKITRTLFFFTRYAGPIAHGLTVEDQTDKITLTFDPATPLITLYYDGGWRFVDAGHAEPDPSTLEHTKRVSMLNGNTPHRLKKRGGTTAGGPPAAA